jgi:hypothetical protein
MTLKIEGEMILKHGRYAIVPLEEYEYLVKHKRYNA